MGCGLSVSSDDCRSVFGARHDLGKNTGVYFLAGSLWQKECVGANPVNLANFAEISPPNVAGIFRLVNVAGIFPAANAAWIIPANGAGIFLVGLGFSPQIWVAQANATN